MSVSRRRGLAEIQTALWSNCENINALGDCLNPLNDESMAIWGLATDCCRVVVHRIITAKVPDNEKKSPGYAAAHGSRTWYTGGYRKCQTVVDRLHFIKCQTVVDRLHFIQWNILIYGILCIATCSKCRWSWIADNNCHDGVLTIAPPVHLPPDACPYDIRSPLVLPWSVQQEYWLGKKEFFNIPKTYTKEFQNPKTHEGNGEKCVYY